MKSCCCECASLKTGRGSHTCRWFNYQQPERRLFTNTVIFRITTVHQYSPIFTTVHQCSPLFTSVHQCSPLFTSVYQCSPIFSNTVVLRINNPEADQPAPTVVGQQQSELDLPRPQMDNRQRDALLPRPASHIKVLVVLYDSKISFFYLTFIYVYKLLMYFSMNLDSAPG